MAHVLTELKIVPKSATNEASVLARELGLELQAKRYEKPLAEHVFTPLTEDELLLWSFHCPTRYASGNDQLKPLEQYGFDSIPIEVMRHWKAIKDTYAFDSYQIWTTEQTAIHNDPLLIGIIGTRRYLLARWGLESPGDMSLQDIALKAYEAGVKGAKEYTVFGMWGVKSDYKRGLSYTRRMWPTFGAAERLLGKA